MAIGVKIAHLHAVTDLEKRFCVRGPHIGAAPGQDTCHVCGFKNGKFLGRPVEKPAFGEEPLQAFHPDLVIAERPVLLGRRFFAGVARHVDVPLAGSRPWPARWPKPRRCHGAWNSGSLASGAIGPKPIMPPMSWGPFTPLSPQAWCRSSSRGSQAQPVHPRSGHRCWRGAWGSRDSGSRRLNPRR